MHVKIDRNHEETSYRMGRTVSKLHRKCPPRLPGIATSKEACPVF